MCFDTMSNDTIAQIHLAFHYSNRVSVLFKFSVILFAKAIAMCTVMQGDFSYTLLQSQTRKARRQHKMHANCLRSFGNVESQVQFN